MRVLLTGASGFLGKKVHSILAREHVVVGTCASHPREGLVPWDLTNLGAIPDFLDQQRPEVVIHTAGLADVSLAHRNPPLSKVLDADSTEGMARWCENNGARLIYISTDYVFDGEHSPYDESSTPYPLQIYGFTKYLGEIAMRSHPAGAVTRLPYLHGFNDAGDKVVYSTDVIRTLGAGKKMVVDHGRIKYPELIDDVAQGLREVIARPDGGIYHLAGTEGVTRYQWGLKIAEVFGFDPDLLVPDPQKDTLQAPDRPRQVLLVNTRLQFRPRSLDEGLRLMKQQMAEAGASPAPVRS